MKKTLERLKNLESFSPSGPASEKEIEEFEKNSGVDLPSDYKEFLETYGSCMWFGASIFGIGEGPFATLLNLQAEHHNKKANSLYPKKLISGAIPIDRNEAGGYYFLNSTGVFLIDDEKPKSIAEKWSSFENFLHYREPKLKS